MATTEEEKGVSPFPQPPALFYKLYTDDNVKLGKAPAPPKPAKGTYFMFGAKFDTEDAILRPLQEQNIKQLYPEAHDRKAELKKLNRSINVCFLELLDILVVNPASPARNQKISDLGCLFINMHHLINEFRPHQARETLKVIMERQKKQREELVNQIQRDMDEAGCILKGCEEFITQSTSTIPRSMQLAQPGGGGAVGEESRRGGMATCINEAGKDDEEPMDTSDGPRSKVGGASKSWSLVETQDAELCKLIDSLIPSNT